MTRRRILLAGLFHETHTFVSSVTGLADFTTRRGQQILDRWGDGSTIDGFLEVAAGEDWEVIPIVEFTALPSGTVEHSVLETYWTELETGLREALSTSAGLDGIWLALHGAMVTSECEDPEGELLSRIRRIPGAEALPLFGVFDLHATFTAQMAQHANGLVAYRENPHADARDSAVRSARLLSRALATAIVPSMLSKTAPVIWPPTGTGTADRPMRDLEQLARDIEAADPSIWAMNVIAGYAFSDVPDAGVSFSLVTVGERAAAEAALDQMVETAIGLREFGVPKEWDLDEVLARTAEASDGPIIIVEPSDNIGGGAPGDGTAVLRGLLRHGIGNAAVAIADPEAVKALQDTKPGETRRIAVGGKGSELGGEPVEINATLVSLSDGRFSLEDRNSHLAASQGMAFNMGPSAVVTVGGKVTVLITSRKTPPFDLAQLRSQGIIPEDLAVIGVKAAVAHRRAYDPIAAASYTVATAGPCASDLTLLPYERIRRPIFPLDPPWRPE